MLRCLVCDNEIAEDRIKAFLKITNGNELPATCEQHAKPLECVGYTIYGHKTAGDVVFLINPTSEQKRQMERAYRRAR